MLKSDENGGLLKINFMNTTNMRESVLSEALADKVLSFWFGDLKDGEVAESEYRKMWWIKDAATDELIKEEFLGVLEAAKGLSTQNLELTPRGSLALIILLDQFSRNIYRDTPGAFSQDELAINIALKGLEMGLDAELRPFERIFYYMPLMHAEDPELQSLSLMCFMNLENEYPEPPELHDKLKGSREYAEKHARIIERFGRYPHRNEILGREPTAEEKEFLKEPGSSF